MARSRYGPQHRAARRVYLAAWHPGDPCALCGKPTLGPARRLDLAHNVAGTGYLGLAHDTCNRGYGQAETNRGRRADPEPRPNTSW